MSHDRGWDDDRGDAGPSKSQRKREAASLQALGEELAGLPVEVLAKLELPDRLKQALEDLRNIPSHEGQRRHRQFIGRLMRDVDPEPLQAFIAAHRRPSREAARLFRVTEEWRDRLAAGEEPVVRAFHAAFPGADEGEFDAAIAALRQGRSGAQRRLFRMIRAVVEQHAASGGSLLE
jgi:ribosome-associated protein